MGKGTGIEVIALEIKDTNIVTSTRKHLKSMGLKEVKLAEGSPQGSPDLAFAGENARILAYCLPMGEELTKEQEECIRRNCDDMKVMIFTEMLTERDTEKMIREMAFLKDRVQKLKGKAEELELEVDELTRLKGELRATVR